jgi:hypothetical protein
VQRASREDLNVLEGLVLGVGGAFEFFAELLFQGLEKLSTTASS